jgi:hypothetical protein
VGVNKQFFGGNLVVATFGGARPIIQRGPESSPAMNGRALADGAH